MDYYYNHLFAKIDNQVDFNEKIFFTIKRSNTCNGKLTYYSTVPP